MTNKQIIIDGCEFQSDCIEYKDISYLKIMPICAIHELSIACHNKVNKCKYYELYKQLKAKEQRIVELNKTIKAKEQECKDLRIDIKDIANLLDLDTGEEYNFDNIEMEIKELKAENEELKQTLTEIRNVLDTYYDDDWKATREIEKILQKISECEETNEN